MMDDRLPWERDQPDNEIVTEPTYLERLKTYYADHKDQVNLIAAIVGGVLLVFLIVWLVWFYAFRTTPQSAVISNKTWERQIEIEKFKTIQDRDWRGQEPSDARIYDERREVHHYEQVPYTCVKTRSVSRVDANGKTSYSTETYTSTCYTSEPVYRTRYYYEVDRWRTERWVVSRGSELKPFWPQLPTTLTTVAVLGNEREGDETRETYSLGVLCDKCDDGATLKLSMSEWDQYTPNQKVTAFVTHGGTVKRIESQE